MKTADESGVLRVLFSKPLKIIGLEILFYKEKGMLKRKILALLLVVVAIFSFACYGGGNVKCQLISSSQTRVVIYVEEADGNVTVENCMEALAAMTDSFSYKTQGGMVTEINGVENPADYSYCWMLYTSDADMANEEWGTITYEGKTLGSAIVGAEKLVVDVGEIYVWEYVKF